MNLSDITGNAIDQNKGRELDLVDPFTGKPTGLKFRIVGPDSDIARRSRLAFADELAELADIDGHVSAEDREKARLNSLARLVVDYTIHEDGKPLAFSTVNLLTLLRVSWVHEQIDAFAGDRANFAPSPAWNANSVDISKIGK